MQTSTSKQYWVQLPDAVKIRAAEPESFSGRKELEPEDLAAGQRLWVTLRRSDGEFLKVKVRQPAQEQKQEPSS